MSPSRVSRDGRTCLSFPHFGKLTRDATPIKKPVTNERAMSEPETVQDPESSPQPLGVAALPPNGGSSGYPHPPSAAACGALVPCRHEPHGCPLSVDIPALTRALAGGDQAGAFRVVRAANPFASTCGNGCHAPCESACRRRSFGAPVALAALEEYAASFSTPMLARPDGPCTSRFEARSVAGAIDRSTKAAVNAARCGKTIAIVGGGPSGLACAHDLALLGHRSIVFDARAEAGGLMTAAIPSFRFPVASARAECAAVLKLDVEFRGGAAIGGLCGLFEAGADAVFVAIGASRAAAPLVEYAQQHPDILDAMDVLSGDSPPRGQTIVAGEGPLAMDAARLLTRHSLTVNKAPSASVQLVLTTPLDAAGVTSELLAACAREGIRIHHGWRVKSVHVDPESGLLASVDMVGPAGTVGRGIPCDRLVLAGPRAPAATAFASEIDLTRSQFIAADPQTLRTSMPNVWAGGACAFGHRSIAHAVADGKRAAWEIHAALTGTRVTTTFASAWVEANGRPKPDRGPADRRRTLPLLEPPAISPFEPATSRAATRAGEEAARCFDCAQLPVVTGECTRCGRCAESCPTGAIAIAEGYPVIESEICNRCGVCIDSCPDGALTLLRAEWEERIALV